MSTEPTFELSAEDLDLLNSKKGLKYLLRQKDLNYKEVVENIRYEKRIKELQIELIKMQSWIVQRNKRVLVIFEGRDFAGKGGAVRKFSEHLNPRNMRSIALPKPSASQKRQWYFRRYIREFPLPGEIAFFDRSWYNRAMVEPVNGFCSKNQYNRFMSEVNQFEEMIMNDGIELIKFYFSISKSELKRRLQEVKQNPLKKWKLHALDFKAIELWDKYTSYKEAMLEKTHRNNSPWVIVDANDIKKAHIESMEHVLSQVIYKK
ncbi:MAG: polyphosphate kinase 2 [Vicingaceae bacterium]